MGVRRFDGPSRRVTKTARWKRLRFEALRRDGFACRHCGARGRLEVDHVLPVRTHPELSFALGNTQALCQPCHSLKTREEVGGAPLSPDRLAWRALARAPLPEEQKCSNP